MCTFFLIKFTQLILFNSKRAFKKIPMYLFGNNILYLLRLFNKTWRFVYMNKSNISLTLKPRLHFPWKNIRITLMKSYYLKKNYLEKNVLYNYGRKHIACFFKLAIAKIRTLELKSVNLMRTLHSEPSFCTFSVFCAYIDIHISQSAWIECSLAYHISLHKINCFSFL